MTTMASSLRVACPKCGVMIMQGARKCRACRKWLTEPPKSQMARSLTLIMATVIAVGAVLISSRNSPVGDAPPLTPGMTADPNAEAAPAAITPDLDKGEQPDVLVTDEGDPKKWRSRQLKLETHPLDLAFNADGNSVYASGDDATIWEIDIADGKVHHMAKMPAQGDRIRLLHGQYLAMIRKVDAAHIPVINTELWDREPTLLWVGSGPADIVGMPDGKSAITASRRGKNLGWFDLKTGRRLGNIRLPHASSQLFLLELPDGQPYVGAMGVLHRGGRPTGAWLDLFDPSEKPFGATRRSIAVGRDPSPGAVSGDRKTVFFADHVSNSASLLSVDETTKLKTVNVGQAPIAAFLMHGDRYGVTLDSGARTATVVDLHEMKRVSTLMLDGVPHHGATSPDGKTLFVSLGGTSWPPREKGTVVISGDPPQVVASLDTDKGAARVAVSPDGKRAAIANYWGRAITIVER
jgi:hypothetical protein